MLGEEQSGQIESIGFTLYMEMLEQAVNALKEGKEPSLDQLLSNHTDIELRVPALLPDDYIPDVNMRLSMYKRIASCDSQEEIDELKIELIDRFGLLPQAAQNLIQISRFRLLAKPLGLKRIEIDDRGGFIDFSQEACINPMFIVNLIQTQPRLYRMDGPTRLRFNLPSDDVKTRFSLVEQILTSLSANQL